MEKDAILVPRSAVCNSDAASSSAAAPAKERRRKSKFKGVVPHPNGNWGSQIYACHHRFWLGTFKTEEEAAAGYYRAALKLRTHEHLRKAGNLPLSQILTAQEMSFQSSYTAEAVIHMIRDGSYQAKFDYFRNGLAPLKAEPGQERPEDNRIRCRRLFQKDLTPSDVGKLNRVVIPKKCAEKFFPRISEGDDNEVSFYDRERKMWKFKYCYWRSSQSYVFTRGWNKFVKEKDLAANDTLAFSFFEGFGDPFFLIDVIKNPNDQVGEAERKSFKLFGAHIFV